MDISDGVSNISNESQESYLDIITYCTEQYEIILEEVNSALAILEQLQYQYNGPVVEYDGQQKRFLEWLTVWEDEFECDTIHDISWGEFIIEKLRECIEI